MTTLISLIRRHPLVAFFGLTFVISSAIWKPSTPSPSLGPVGWPFTVRNAHVTRI